MKPRLIRNVTLDGRRCDIAIEGERIVAIGPGLRGEEIVDARGGAALPGLHDHHLHLLATAAQRASVPLDDCRGPAAVADRLATAARTRAPGSWLRATGYHEHGGALLDWHALDAIERDRPLRVQHQTGALWILNSAALARIGSAPWPESVECDPRGVPTGRIWRGDEWLATRIPRQPPDLAALGRELAAHGITGVCDASVSTDAGRAALLADAVRDGSLPFELMLMSGGDLTAPADGAFHVGAVKIVLDDDRLPPIDAVVDTIRQARRWRRPVAVHCVTAAELAVAVAALAEAGTRPGDRIEHGNVIPAAMIAELRAMRLTVVMQPGFVLDRGDRYRALVPADERADLFRCASLGAGGVATAASSDAPYGTTDPWRAMHAVVNRRTAGGAAFGVAEALCPASALDLYLAPLADPGGPPRRLRVGSPADICILSGTAADRIANPDAGTILLTLHGGRNTFGG